MPRQMALRKSLLHQVNSLFCRFYLEKVSTTKSLYTDHGHARFLSDVENWPDMIVLLILGKYIDYFICFF